MWSHSIHVGVYHGGGIKTDQKGGSAEFHSDCSCSICICHYHRFIQQNVRACVWWDFLLYLCVFFGRHDMISVGINALLKRVCLCSKTWSELGEIGRAAHRVPRCCQSQREVSCLSKSTSVWSKTRLTATLRRCRRTETQLFSCPFTLHTGLTFRGHIV